VTDKRRKPRINHVALSVPADLLDAKHREEIVGFYGEVFGWEEHATETVDRTKLVLRVHSNEQFVFLVAESEPMRCAPLDHFGISVGTVDELDETYAAARSIAARDDRVRLVEKSAEDFGGALVLTSFYVGFLLPMMIEVQHFDWKL
jgi:hypothetical protein